MPPTIAPSLSDKLLANVPAAVFFLLLFDSFHLVFARLLAPLLPPTVSAFWVLGLATLEIMAVLGWQGRVQWHLLRLHGWFFAAVGFLVAAATILSYTSVSYIDPGTASLLARASTLFSIALGLVWLRERLNGLGWLGTAVALVGVVIISFQPGDYLRLGALLVLGSSLVYALHAAVVKRYGGEMDFANFFLFRVGATTAFLLLFVVAGGAWQWPTWQAWLILAVAGTVDVVLSRVLYYLILRRIEMSFHAIILTLSPVITILWAWLFFDEWPTLRGLGGGALVLAGVMLVTRSRQAPRHRS